jgi:hypothetical protein
MNDIADVEMAMAALRGVEVMGRALRTDYAESKNRGATQRGSGQRKESRWVDFLNNGQKEGSGGDDAAAAAAAAAASSHYPQGGAADVKVADISMADSYSVGNNNRNNNNRRRGSSDGDGRRKVAASLYVFCSMFFIPFLVCDGLCLSIFLS